MRQTTKITFHSLDPAQHQKTINYLKDRGAEVQTTRMLELKGNPDVILIEANFPYYNIFKFLKSLHTGQSTATILLMGPDLDVGRVSTLLRAGVFDYIKLPFPPSRLEKTIREGLKNRSMLLKVLDLSAQLEMANKKLSQERDQLKQWNNDLSQIYDLNQSLSESLDLDGIVESLMENIKNIVPFDIACLYIKGWDQVHIELNRNKWGTLIDRIRDETRQDALRLSKTKCSVPRPIVRQGDSEILVPLQVGKSNIGLLRLIRKVEVNGGKKIKKGIKNGSHRKNGFSDYQSKVLSMISAPLAISIRNAEMYKQVEDLAVRDALTNALNRRAFSGILEREFRRAERYNTSLALMVIDLDHFKMVNDTYGHLVGDHVLREMASIFQKSLRDIDVLIRYGGEEFVVVLPGTDLEKGRVVANRIKERVEKAVFNKADNAIRMTVSIGLTHYPTLPIISVPETLFLQADQALYAAKRNGRNQIMTSESTEGKACEVLVLEGQATS